MLARHFRIAQLFELVAYAAFGSLLHATYAWPIERIVIAALIVAAGWRIGMVCLSFVLGWVLGSPRTPEQAIGLAATVRMVVEECYALLRFQLVEVPWERAVMRADPEPRPTDRIPVVLIHGYFASRGYFRTLVRRLEAVGVAPIYTPNLRSHRASIEDYEEDLHAAIERVAGAAGRKVVLIAHSMGGVGARAYLARRGTHRVSRLITIASPHHGTALAALGSGMNARQMRRGCGFLAALERAEGAAGPGIPALSIYSPNDNMVFPQETSRLPWARNVALPGLGHLGMMASDALLEELLNELRAAGVVPQP